MSIYVYKLTSTNQELDPRVFNETRTLPLVGEATLVQGRPAFEQLKSTLESECCCISVGVMKSDEACYGAPAKLRITFFGSIPTFAMARTYRNPTILLYSRNIPTNHIPRRITNVDAENQNKL